MLVSEHHASGLIVARDSMDEESVGSALRRATDGRFVLQKRRRHEDDPGDVAEVYKVVHVETGQIVFTWMDDFGNPLPLSSGLLDAFQSLMLGARNKPLSEDEWNRRELERRRADVEREKEAVMDDHRPYMERGRISVSMSDAGKRRYWQRGGKIPTSGARFNDRG